MSEKINQPITELDFLNVELHLGSRNREIKINEIEYPVWKEHLIETKSTFKIDSEEIHPNQECAYTVIKLKQILQKPYPASPDFLYILCFKSKDKYESNHTLKEFYRTTDEHECDYIIRCWKVDYEFEVIKRFFHKCKYCGNEHFRHKSSSDCTVHHVQYIKEGLVKHMYQYSRTSYFDDPAIEIRLKKEFVRADTFIGIPKKEIWYFDTIDYDSWEWCGCEASIEGIKNGDTELPF